MTEAFPVRVNFLTVGDSLLLGQWPAISNNKGYLTMANLNWHPFGGFHSYATLNKYNDEPVTYGSNDRDGVRYSWVFTLGSFGCTVTAS